MNRVTTVQVKKDTIRARIIAAAAGLFEKKGYVGCTVGEIAKQARIGTASVYVYFPSKLDIAFAIFEPWLLTRIAQTEIDASKILNSRDRLRYIITRFWRDVPRERNYYLRSFLQALAISSGDDANKSRLYAESRDRISRLITGCLPNGPRTDVDTVSLAHIVIMAFDGFVINSHLECSDDAVEAMCTMILGKAPAAQRIRR